MKYKHAELMMQYAQDAMETDKPWELWEMRFTTNKTWSNCTDGDMYFSLQLEYRRKPKMISVTLMDGEVVSWPEPYRGSMNINDAYWCFDGDKDLKSTYYWDDFECQKESLKNGMVHLTKEAAMQHAAALLKINNQVAK